MPNLALTSSKHINSEPWYSAPRVNNPVDQETEHTVKSTMFFTFKTLDQFLECYVAIDF